MLSRVITSCGGMSIATTRSETVWTLVSSGGRNRNPGPFAPHERPRTNSPPRSYSLNTFRPDRTYKNTMPRAAGRAMSMSVPSGGERDRKSTRLNSSHSQISYAVFCLKKKKHQRVEQHGHPTHPPVSELA